MNAWLHITSDKTILQYVKRYKIPFEREGFRTIVPPEPRLSARENLDYDRPFPELLSEDAMTKCLSSENQFISPYFLREEPNGDKRFILNLKKIE